jgi:ABC-type Fe3+ transport system substrate-binding protein
MKDKSLNLLLLFLTTILTSCIIERAKKDDSQQLIIFSDCLTKEDVNLFSNFQKNENIKISIQTFNTDTLLSKIEREGYNCKADVVILNSMYSIQKILYKGLLQPWNSKVIDKNIPDFLRSKSNHWIGIGINPYSLASNDTILISDNLDKIISQNNTTLYSNIYKPKDFIPLISHFFNNRYEEEKVKTFINKITYSNNKNLKKDSIHKNIYISMFSDIVRDSILTNKTLINIEKGIYYNMYCTGIIKQSPNFYNAKIFIEYITGIENNDSLNNRWKTLPIHTKNKGHRFSYQNQPRYINNKKHKQLYTTYSLLERCLHFRKLEKNIK